jgi:hypothetical protein
MNGKKAGIFFLGTCPRQSRDFVGINGLRQSLPQVFASDSRHSVRNALNTEESAAGAHVRDQETHKYRAGP